MAFDLRTARKMKNVRIKERIFFLASFQAKYRAAAQINFNWFVSI